VPAASTPYSSTFRLRTGAAREEIRRAGFGAEGGCRPGLLARRGANAIGALHHRFVNEKVELYGVEAAATDSIRESTAPRSLGGSRACCTDREVISCRPTTGR